MEKGSAVIHTTTAGLFLMGFSFQKLFFRRPGARPRDDISVMGRDQRRVAFRCAKCGGMFVSSTPTALEYA
jgi:hypothetical protein